MITKITAWSSLFDFGFLLLLLLIFVYFWRDFRKTQAAKLWVKTKGTVESYELENAGHSLWPKIEYSYEVDHQEFRGHQFFLPSAHKEIYSLYARKLAYRIGKSYQQGETIDVYYNPNDPSEAVLDITISHKLKIIIILVAAFIILHLSLIFHHLLT
ncbi:Protein of uncharacterised function (DUF3592) (plasmid) [Legionella adelaidensis]|uniref:Protein of uncharacterized function (DUF3592) n=1 Tax=Legionella adelaidensis TaxID=45056 RepID=A0A0W0R136_9GAMM|nr:DUF3592 domain-containing protein [Legionella adelaidensis]KTC64665.1 hypothetical protein Lade_1959 [Legionella adelaidensis]VEH86133.1 Protein of uncharacterised function (DUF3592) [Legionella adelaidensis]